MTKYGCEYWLIYSIIVAGKSAEFANSKMRQLAPEGTDIFKMLRRCNNKHWMMMLVQKYKLGNYKKLTRAFMEVCQLNAKTCTLEDLEKIHGIGPKTSRFFIMLRNPETRVAALDTHILKWLREKGYNAPKSTPQSGAKYKELEAAFIREADRIGVTPRALDIYIWEMYSGRNKKQ